jgi:NAD(P)-dependent dehydrogenase (short-subunit alcohol dehydrogenase family)
MLKLLLITGSGRGIGAATAILAARQDYQVCVNYKNDHTSASSVVDQIVKNGGKAFSYQADVSNEPQVKELFNMLDSYGRIDAMVNNAGILESQMRTVDMTVERWHRILDSNLISCFLCCREAIKRMSTNSGGIGGTIVNVSSIAARSGAPGEYTDYAASKSALESFTVGLAKEVAAEGIRVNGVRPAFIYTGIHADGGEPGRVDRIKNLIPMKRGGKPEEVAQSILWLLSENSSFSTGTFIDVTGGQL